ncbi:MAG: alpha/beta fold hydrolase [Burkholderiaceae bacterium]|nr:alpha/beta fold hydrolase [Burkholderiaceae bacterium]
MDACAVTGIPSLLPPDERQRLASGRRLRTVHGGCDLVWHEWQPESARQGSAPVVLFHGGSGSWTHWVKNIGPLLDAGRRVLAADLPGFGDSAPLLEGSDADAMLEPLAAGLRTLLPGAAVDLVGFSFGGMTAGMLLAAYPELAARLVLVGAPAMGVASERQLQLKGWRHLAAPQERAGIHRHNLGVLMLHDHSLIDGLALQVHTANVLRDRLPRRRLARTDILARSLASVPCPVHAIYGAHDVLYHQGIDQLQHAYAAAAPDFRGLRLIEGAGHWVQFEAPQAFNAALCLTLDD